MGEGEGDGEGEVLFGGAIGRGKSPKWTGR